MPRKPDPRSVETEAYRKLYRDKYWCGLTASNDGAGVYDVTVSKIRGWRQSGVMPLTTDTGAAFVQANSGGLNAPKAPSIFVTVPVSVVGGRYISGCGSATKDIVTVGIMSVTAANFGSAAGISVPWMAVLDE